MSAASDILAGPQAAVAGPIPGAGAAVPVPAGSRRYGVLIGGERLLLGADGAVRVLDAPPAFRLPNTCSWFLGLSNVRGTLVPVYDLAAWQGLPAPDGRRMLLVMGEGEAAAAVLVDTSPRHLLVPPGAGAVDAPALSPGVAAHAGDTFVLDGAAWTEVDWGALFEQLKTLALGAG